MAANFILYIVKTTWYKEMLSSERRAVSHLHNHAIPEFFDNERTQFLSLVQELSPPGELVEDAMFQFSFNVDEKYESYL
ncbi:hypothetical protein R3P38DRAFT_3237678 [Favolaschia claudopus]|uniref:Uncharacterized protein n=1 Tax=Favolaschia claudopus TaxID=2862362 RepID=A0AAV9ZAA4_9AGAR